MVKIEYKAVINVPFLLFKFFLFLFLQFSDHVWDVGYNKK